MAELLRGIDNLTTIGIITFHSAHNYGAVLQAYALQTVLKDNFKVKIINYRNEFIDKNFKVFALRDGNLKIKVRSILINILFFHKNYKRYNAFETFFREYYQLTPEYKSITSEENNMPDFDIYITGSDQVWNPSLAGGLSDAYTLNWGRKTAKRIAYAASVGDISIINSNREQYKAKLNKLDAISVREENLQVVLEKILKRKINVTLDPSLLLSRKQWDALIIPGPTEKYIFAYAIGNHEEHKKIVDAIAKSLGISVVQVERKNKYHNVLYNKFDSGPQEFLGLIRDAEVIVTTSFHATVFSILYHKKFWAVPPEDTGERIYNLLRMLGLEHRCINRYDAINLNEKIDYMHIDSIIEKEREISLKWLMKELEMKK